MLTFVSKNSLEDISYSIILNNETIYQVNCIKFLKVDIDNKLIWKHHVNNNQLKPIKHIYLLRQLIQMISLDVFKLLYHNLIQSDIAYGLK